MEADFSGWATKAGLKCSDGVTITRGAFQHMDKKRVPLLWQHGHNNPNNVLGHAVLESRDEGVYAYAFFNNSQQGQSAKEMVRHGDIQSLSIFANQLSKQGQNVVHGMIREVSLVLAGANPEAVIDFVAVAHGDGEYETIDAAEIRTGDPIQISDNLMHADEDEDDEEDDDEDVTVKEIFDGFTEEEKNVVHFIVGSVIEDLQAKGESVKQSDEDKHTITHTEGGDHVSRNVFDQSATTADDKNKKHTLSHADVASIVADASKCGSLKEATTNYALQHGIDNIDVLFPDAKMATGTIELEKRRTEWVKTVLDGTRHTPFSRIKTFVADLRQDEARAKGYIKGNYKLEEWIGVTKRTTGPTTVYKKQKLDRDDILDITDFDIVTFLKSELRLMTEEEVARAILIGDGRSPVDEDKIKDPLGSSDGIGIRSILNDHELFVTRINVNVDAANTSYEDVVDAVMDGMEFYKGTGTPDLFTTVRQLNKFLKAKDGQGRRYYANKSEVAEVLGVRNIYTVEPMNEVQDLVGIIVNLDDYNTGTDRGGEMTMFDDFDIDYNQYKYLLETRLSGALVRPKSALIIQKTAVESVLAQPVKPAFNSTTGVVTIPSKTGVEYKNGDGETLTAGAQPALGTGETTTVYAVAVSGYHFASSAETSWPFSGPRA